MSLTNGTFCSGVTEEKTGRCDIEEKGKGSSNHRA